MKFIISIALSIFGSTFLGANHRELTDLYINNFKDVAMQEMQRTGIPASIKLAQGLLESDWGRSDLATTANNHFGIKCGSQWRGGTFYKEDDDRNKKGELIESCFRAFSTPMESYKAHSDFLSDPRKDYRYGILFTYAPTDYKSWAKGLKKSGYATDPQYPNKLIRIIENYDLNRFDKQALRATNTTVALTNQKSNKNEEIASTVKKKEVANSHKPNKIKLEKQSKKNNSRIPAKHVSRLLYDIESYNRCKMVTAKGGETIKELAKKVGVSPNDLLAYNELYIQEEDVLSAGDFVYLEKKQRKYRGEQEYHLVVQGQTMQQVAQLYGIRLQSLYAKNRMPKNSETVAGQKLFLQSTAGLSERPKFKLIDSKRKHKYLFEDDDTVK